jgi:tetratricopeptide (TPR) repeat protein
VSGRYRVLLAGAVATIVATATLLGGALRETTAAPRVADLGRALAEPSGSLAAGDTANVVAELERQASQRPSDPDVLARLGLAYQQRARETGDPALYPRSERVLVRAHAAAPADWVPLYGLATLAASRHQFRTALELAERARRLHPRSAAVYGVLGDAALELGRYGRAFAAFDRMAALKPSAAAYARVSYARELLGNTAGAIDTMQLAVDAAGFSGEPAAWARVKLGDLYLGSGRLRRAAGAYREARAFAPAYAPAIAALGDVALARSRPRAAATLYAQALALSPLPEYASALGDVRARLGDTDGAKRAYARARRLEARFARFGGRNRLETALFDLDRDVHLRDALARAREGYRERPSIEGEHVLAWALYKNGRCAEARAHSIRALRLGTKDLDALYHRSLIEACLGNRRASRAFLDRLRSANPLYLRTPPSPFRLRPS